MATSGGAALSGISAEKDAAGARMDGLVAREALREMGELRVRIDALEDVVFAHLPIGTKRVSGEVAK